MRPLRIAPQRRPAGSGAFWDYAEAIGRPPDERTTCSRRAAGLKVARIAAEAESANERWDNEGGKPAA